MKKTLLTALLGSCVFLASANDPLVRKCSSNDLLMQQLANDPGRAATMQQIENQTAAYIQAQNKNGGNSTQATVTIPVVFHIVYNTTAQNISDAKCIAQLNQLNLDFARMNSDAGNTPAAFAGLAANTNIQFCLAQRDPNGLATTGIIHKSTTTTSFSDNDNVKRNANGGDNTWDATKYLNIWACNLGGGLLGYAQFPGGSTATDGVVVLYSSVGSMLSHGTASQYDLGRTATHEVGHWVNLRHIWGDESACNADDLVSDTPQQKAENYGCPSYPQTTQSGGRCSTANPSSMFMNYMDYTDDACMNMFSAGQASRMQAIFAVGGSRAAMTSSLGCTPPSGGTCNVATGLNTSSITASSATLNWTAASGATSYNLQYRIVGAGNWTSTTSTTTSKAISGLTASSNYEWQVQTVCSGGSSAFSSSSTFTTSAGASCGVPSGVTAGSLTGSGATISWTAVAGATSYNLNWKLGSAGSYTTITGITTTSRALTGLTSCTAYNFQVQAICASGSSAFSTAGTFTTTGCSVSYCTSSGTNTTYEYISKVALGTISNTSGNNSGYGNYTSLSTNLAGSSSNTITLTPGFTSSAYREYWKVYVDYNKNGVFTDAGENVATVNSTAAVSATFTVPASALNGATRMRVQMQYNASPSSSCGTFTYGEVEDYTVNITGNAQRPMAVETASLSFAQLTLYPNPTDGIVNVSFIAAEKGNASIRIVDMIGKVLVSEKVAVYEGNNKLTFDMTPYSKGLYFVELSNESNHSIERLILDK
ncbi:hypothetical protein BH11BAC1_BH11BAC1_05830 [soil metagenome]